MDRTHPPSEVWRGWVLFWWVHRLGQISFWFLRKGTLESNTTVFWEWVSVANILPKPQLVILQAVWYVEYGTILELMEQSADDSLAILLICRFWYRTLACSSLSDYIENVPALWCEELGTRLWHAAAFQTILKMCQPCGVKSWVHDFGMQSLSDYIENVPALWCEELGTWLWHAEPFRLYWKCVSLVVWRVGYKSLACRSQRRVTVTLWRLSNSWGYLLLIVESIATRRTCARTLTPHCTCRCQTDTQSVLAHTQLTIGGHQTVLFLFSGGGGGDSTLPPLPSPFPQLKPPLHGLLLSSSFHWWSAYVGFLCRQCNRKHRCYNWIRFRGRTTNPRFLYLLVFWRVVLVSGDRSIEQDWKQRAYNRGCGVS